MLRHDFHLHTRFSADSRDDPRAYCLRALERGCRAVCFTDHADFERADPGYGHFDYGRYRQAILACREEFRGRLMAGCGVEIDYRYSREDEIRAFLMGKEFDYILGSVHYLDGGVPILDERYLRGRDRRQVYEEYFAEVLALVRSGLCQGVAHLDVIERGGAKVYGPYDARAFQDSLEPIFAAMAERGLALEINLSGYRYGLGKPTPGLEVVDLYRRAGGKLVTIGSDAHRPEDCCPEHPEVWAYMERNGMDLWEPAPGFWEPKLV